MAQLEVHLFTPERDVLHTHVDQLTAPSVQGEVGILAQHLPLLAQLQPGPVGLFSGGEVIYYAVSGGFVEVQNDVVTLLADSAERQDEIDARRSKKALKDAGERLKKLDPTDPEFDEQQARIRRAEVRLWVAGKAE